MTKTDILRRWTLTYRYRRRKRNLYFWTSFTGWVVPAVMWFWGLWMLVAAIILMLWA